MQPVIAVIGLGYVGLPLAVEFASKYHVLGFDVKAERIAQLRAGHDETLEVPESELAGASRLRFTDDPSELSQATVFVVTVPTPIDDAKRPDLRPLVAASRTVGATLKPGDTVIYESTVYPGATE
ncbi:MAG: Vi polysaccharide biosynthesis UDP-N-acetylglucosamine C-6 dehydrogenase TviB, partial [Anaerolineae bacterium]|nr:Vi polysaccharide biosynthesis UDP-N-acetylglucosamine C-6 dehydrogenase TviB [Anaerolineae bacterium]